MKKTAILIVSDSEHGVGLEISVALTGRTDIELMYATDRAEIARLYVAHEFAVVLFDTTARGVDAGGIDEWIRIFQTQPATPIIFMTTSQEEALRLCRQTTSEFIDYIVLPFSPKFLQDKLQVYLQLHQLEKTVTLLADELDARKLELEVVYQELAETYEKQETFSALDGLTGLFNRHYFDENMQKEWRQATRNKKPLSLLFIDVDYLREFNRSYGRGEGDNCLCALAGVIHLGLLRPVDIVARYGGDQFAVILPDTDSHGAMLVAERMLENVRALLIDHSTSPVAGHVTISVGGATVLPSAKGKKFHLIGEAEKALAEAKAAGRNCIRHNSYKVP
ncbi:diguanylate cyclase domain-containing protein [Desulforhopalus sp. IMCC35007]|uniref:GGDEF domain-containing response regulator n=1 Tax=Desulforhopalus sp. IMCC35007 TaxID=2569543 RepID=UPI00145FC69D|nr:diguanylate cyclase [Desulforhopalus sp. IMCC35007]